MKKIIAVTQVQNGADIIESLCRYYCSFCDGILVTNNVSTDNTQNILDSLIKEGLPVFLSDKLNNPFLQFHYAIDEYQADIILPADADEFLVNIDGGSPRPLLESLDETVEYHIPCRNYTCPRELNDNTLFYPSNISKYSKFSYFKTAISRFLIKQKGAWPDRGRHSFMYHEDPPRIIDHKKLCYNHYPIRNLNQFLLKAIVGWACYLTYPYHDGSIHYNETWQWKAFYDEIKKHGAISKEQLEKYSAYTGNSLPDDNYELYEGPFDTSFCTDKLKLRYTNYPADASNERFLQMLTIHLELHLRAMPLWRADMERKEAGERLGIANATIHNLNQYIDTLTQPNNPKTWKVYKLMKKVFRFFFPKKNA